jgi:ABC-type branched-subunit amino acid transport system substrate-binding protein
MRLFFVFAVLLIAGFETTTLGQKMSYDSRYRAALEDYKQRRYALCMEKLIPLTSVTTVYPNAEYAHYYYALAAYESKKYKESRLMLLQLQNRFPGWNKQNEVNYLLGANTLATGQWKDAFSYLQKIKDSSFGKDIQSLKHNYLSRIGDLSTLINLQKQYPDDREVALEVVLFVERSSKSTATDKYYADQLIKRFKFAREADAESKVKKSSSRVSNQWTKGYFNVSVLLPFRLDEYLSSKKRSNQFAYDYYLGLLIAKDKLKSEGIDIRLWSFDVGNEPKVMSAITDDKVFQQSDLVIGPLYQGTFDIAANFVADVNMVMLNPLSTDGSLLTGSENIFLAHPSISFQMKKAAEWMGSVAGANLVAIYYGSAAKDSAMAAAYSSEIISRGGKVIEMLKVRSDRESQESQVSPFSTQKPSHVAVFSAESGTGSALIETLNTRKLTAVPVIGTSTAFNLQIGQNRNGNRLYLIEPDHVDRSKEEVRLFQKNYWGLANTFPSVYSYQGYDQLLFFGRMLSKYKDKLGDGLELRRYDADDYLLSGFDYTKSRDNQVPFILRYVGGKWEPVK